MARISRAQLIQACEVLDLDAARLKSVLIEPHGVTATYIVTGAAFIDLDDDETTLATPAHKTEEI